MPCADKNVRCEQYALLVIFCVAFIAEDRFIKEADLFSAVLGFLHSLQCNGDHIPSYVIKATFFLLAVCQEHCEDLNLTSVNLICKILEDAQDVKILHFHHPFYLKFFFRYPQLMENYGCSIITFWILNEDPIQICEDGRLSEDCKISELTNNQGYFLPLLNILQSNHNSIPVFLELIIRGPSELSQKVLLVLKVFLKGNVSSFVSGFFANQLLKVLQKILIQSTDAKLQGNFPTFPMLISYISLKHLSF
uniref:Uncharacterized protein n=1 Tax=Leptobrachium leishanense TaxID=445787 RepID=A0A8C5QVT9_9ANUR